ncbi:hypothetical protein [Rhodococcus sp. NCIMB 12038]|uniref:hypothetical protein n=1 Tax=Rhodococcus sp. NCIMB 12038 TaxID=933800 RepID=UPI000B3C1674|nr:hypothetical protein [Rhodococcus sp. NCIMB 12038]OUS91921.1 hypothetical protein CA951_31105 [Rhodococcus sp. NCIMB 12038]
MRASSISLLAAVAVLTGCTADGPEPATASPASTEAATEGPKRNAQGRIEKRFGEPAGLNDTATGQPALTFTLSNPRTNPECTGFWKFIPDHQYLFVDIEVSTTDDYADAVTGANNRSIKTMADRNLSAANWRAVGPDDVVLTDLVSTAALNCEEMNDDALREPFAPASTYRGSFVFDVPAGTKSLYLDMLGKDIGWEWAIPAELAPGSSPGAANGF